MALPAAADTVEFTIADTDITESSGLATDADAERYWTVNDSGDAGIAYALDDQGETAGDAGVPGRAGRRRGGRLPRGPAVRGRHRRQPGPPRHRHRLLLRRRRSRRRNRWSTRRTTSPTPTEPHDAETLLVDGDGRLFIVTKGAEGGIYAAPSVARPGRASTSSSGWGTRPPFVTDGTVLADGRFALRTYVSVEVVDPDSYEVVARAATPAQKQGESITTTFDGKSLLIGSEGKRSKVLRIDIPTGLDAAPTSVVRTHRRRPRPARRVPNRRRPPRPDSDDEAEVGVRQSRRPGSRRGPASDGRSCPRTRARPAPVGPGTLAALGAGCGRRHASRPAS